MNNNIQQVLFLCLILTGICFEGSGQEKNRNKVHPPAVTPGGIAADMVNIKYGDHNRNVFDLWLADTEQASPLVIYIHGGGFRGGDKSKIYKTQDIDYYLNNGISFASINYRFMTGDSLGVRACLYDSKRALQFIRSKATKWNIDKDKIAIYGGSAGAGTSLWLAFHDEMADPENADPVLRESTRILAAGARGTQATYNLSRWTDILKLDEGRENNPDIWKFYGLNSAEEINSPAGQEILAELDMLELMDKNDPVFYVYNPQKGGLPPENRGHINHHPLHAKALLVRAEEVGAKAYIYAPQIGIAPADGKQENMEEFIVRILKQEY